MTLNIFMSTKYEEIKVALCIFFAYFFFRDIYSELVEERIQQKGKWDMYDDVKIIYLYTKAKLKNIKKNMLKNK